MSRASASGPTWRPARTVSAAASFASSARLSGPISSRSRWARNLPRGRRGVAPSGERNPEPGRQIVDEGRDRVQACRVRDPMDVVKDEHRRRRPSMERRGQPRHGDPERPFPRPGEPSGDGPVDRPDPVERGREIRQQHRRIVVEVVQGHPRDVAMVVCRPLDQHRRLAVPGGRHQRHDAWSRRILELREEPGARHHADALGWPAELGLDQRQRRPEATGGRSRCAAHARGPSAAVPSILRKGTRLPTSGDAAHHAGATIEGITSTIASRTRRQRAGMQVGDVEPHALPPRGRPGPEEEHHDGGHPVRCSRRRLPGHRHRDDGLRQPDRPGQGEGRFASRPPSSSPATPTATSSCSRPATTWAARARDGVARSASSSASRRRRCSRRPWSVLLPAGSPGSSPSTGWRAGSTTRSARTSRRARPPSSPPTTRTRTSPSSRCLPVRSRGPWSRRRSPGHGALKDSLAEAMGKFAQDRTVLPIPDRTLRRIDRPDHGRVRRRLVDDPGSEATRGRPERPDRARRRRRVRRPRHVRWRAADAERSPASSRWASPTTAST